MQATIVRRKRLEQLLDLALVYRDCTRKELARGLGRDPTKLVPGTGIPKLDLVVQLASALDWSVGEVVGFLWGDQSARPDVDGPPGFHELAEAADRSLRSNDHRQSVQLCRDAYTAAATARQRARACHREARAWEQTGRYLEVVLLDKGFLRFIISCDKKIFEKHRAEFEIIARSIQWPN